MNGDITRALTDLSDKVLWAHNADEAEHYRARQDDLLDLWLDRAEQAAA